MDDFNCRSYSWGYDEIEVDGEQLEKGPTSGNIEKQTTKTVRTDSEYDTQSINFKRAQWDLFAKDLDYENTKIEPIPQSYEDFVNLMQEICRRYILRGCRTQYITKTLKT